VEECHVTCLAVLHNVELSEPSLIEWIACRVYDMAESVLFRQDQHRIQETLHGIIRLDEHRSNAAHVSMGSDYGVTTRLTAYAPHRKGSQASSWGP
jgi:hypothetical protein